MGASQTKVTFATGLNCYLWFPQFLVVFTRTVNYFITISFMRTPFYLAFWVVVLPLSSWTVSSFSSRMEFLFHFLTFSVAIVFWKMWFNLKATGVQSAAHVSSLLRVLAWTPSDIPRCKRWSRSLSSWDVNLVTPYLNSFYHSWC